MRVKCKSCGMPMVNPEDFPLGDTSKDYCVHCARPDGSMHSYGERLEALTGFIVRTQGMDENVARTMAVELMKSMPAWKNHEPPDG